MAKRLPDPTTNPAGPGFASTKFTDLYDYKSHNLSNGITIAVEGNAHVWELHVIYNDFIYDDAIVGTLVRYLRSLRGPINAAEIVIPQHSKPKNGVIDASVGTIAAGQTGETLVITDWLSIGSAHLVPGDFVQLSDSSRKLYEVHEVNYSANTNNGTLTLTLYPNLAAPTLGSDKLIVEPVFQGKLTTKKLTLNVTPDGIVKGFTTTYRESIE